MEPRTNVVIGAASGMGTAVARRLAPRGRLLLADRDRAATASLAEELGSDVEVLACDITHDDDVRALAGASGSLGALVLTAGLSPRMGDGRRIFDVNLVATDRVVRSFEPLLEEGSVAVCFASMAARMVPADGTIDALLDDPGSPEALDGLCELGMLDDSGLAYAISKRGVVRLVERRAAIWGAVGARLLSLSPGIIDTPMGRLESSRQPEMAAMVGGSALARMGTADEIAAVVAFLTSPDASFMTGTDVLVDGGAVAGRSHGGTES